MDDKEVPRPYPETPEAISLGCRCEITEEGDDMEAIFVLSCTIHGKWAQETLAIENEEEEFGEMKEFDINLN